PVAVREVWSGNWRFLPRRIRSSPLQTVATPHDDATPIHRTSRSRVASGKFRAEGNVRRICKRRDASRRKPIGNAGVCRTQETQLESESSINSGKQEEKEYDQRRGLKK